jgi:phosphoribosylaminoimidazolecarboxamide formyltransferase/IMP cyclohydrolase
MAEAANIKKMYSAMEIDPFPARMEIRFIDDEGAEQALRYRKVTWDIGGERMGLRYGENPGQPAALFKLESGLLRMAGYESVQPGLGLVSEAELLQSGKHPGKTNLTDVDSALNIMRHLGDAPACAIMKHNNPSGVAIASSVAEAYEKAYLADRVAAFGGAVVLNAKVDAALAREICASYSEVVAAPDFEAAALKVFAEKKNLRVIRIPRMADLGAFARARVPEFRALVDGSIVAQWSFLPETRSAADFIDPVAVKDGKRYEMARKPTEAEARDLLFAWLVETGITSNSVIFCKDGVTLGIGTGEQDRVGVAEIARDKAYRKLEDRLCFLRHGVAWNQCEDEGKKAAIREEVAAMRADLPGSVAASDAFFPFRDGIEVCLKEGVSAVVQPGGGIRDYEVIEAANEYGAAMVFTGQRCFRH